MQFGELLMLKRPCGHGSSGKRKAKCGGGGNSSQNHAVAKKKAAKKGGPLKVITINAKESPSGPKEKRRHRRWRLRLKPTSPIVIASPQKNQKSPMHRQGIDSSPLLRKELFDSETDKTPPSKKQRRRGRLASAARASAEADAPAKSLEDMHAYMSRLAQEFKEDGFDFDDSMLAKPLVITCKWCGAGIAISSWLLFVKEMEKHFDRKIKWRLHSTCDKMALCRKLCVSYLPEHSLKDMLDHYKKKGIDAVRKTQNKYRQQMAMHDDPEEQKKDLQERKDRVMDFFKMDIEEVMRKTPWFMDDGAEIPPDLAKDEIWIEFISPDCTAWSSQGAQQKWLDPSNVALMLYCGRLREDIYRPTMVLCECTKQLDLRWMEELSQHKMTFASGKMGPEVWGLPVGGVRGWSPGYSKTSRWKFTSHPMHEDRVVHYAKNFKTVDPLFFMTDSDTEISLYQDHVNKQGAQIPPHPKGKRFRWRDLLSVGNRSRLENHEEITGSLRHQYSVRPHSVDPSVNRPQLYDIMQNPTHHQSPTGKIPRPL